MTQVISKLDKGEVLGDQVQNGTVNLSVNECRLDCHWPDWIFPPFSRLLYTCKVIANTVIISNYQPDMLHERYFKSYNQ